MARDRPAEPASSSDEWSSSSDDESQQAQSLRNREPVSDDSSSSEDEDSSSENRARKPSFQQYSSDEDDSSSDDDRNNETQSDDDDSFDGNTSSRRQEVSSSRYEVDDDEASQSSRDDERLPLGERLLKKEERRNEEMLQRAKERKKRARKLVAEKLKQFKKDKQAAAVSSEGHKEASATKKKKSKHAPTEVSSKRGDFFRQKRTLNESGIGVAIGAHRFKPRDPRVSSLSGTLDQDHFERNYEFVEGIRDKEIEQLKQRIAARKVTGAKGNKKRRKLGITGDNSSLEKDVQRLRELQQEKAAIERSRMERNAKRSVKKKLQQEVEDGKRSATHFLNRREMKKRVTEAKFEELRKRGGDGAVQKALEKKRKKNKSRDAKKGI